ncbi:MAG: hypothetical protein WD425_09515 [Nitrospirales bacterium]
MPSCRLQPEKYGRYEAHFSTLGIYSGGAGKKLAGQQLSVLLARISAFLNARVLSERYVGEKLPLPPEKQRDQIFYGVKANCKVPMEVRPSEPRAVQKAELKNLLRLSALPHGSHDIVLVVFRTAVMQPEALGKFMLLYQCLLQIDDKQKVLDKQIQHLRPNVPLFTRPQKNGTETFYTRLRNEVAHPRPGVSVDSTLDAIERSVDEFRAIVHERILEKIVKPMLIP